MIDRQPVYAVHKAVVADRSRQFGLSNPTIWSRAFALNSEYKTKNCVKTYVESPYRRSGYDSAILATEMSNEPRLPGAPKPDEGPAGQHSDSPTRTAGVTTKVRHSSSTPLLGGYNSRRFWRSSSTIVWCSTADHSDFDRLNRGRYKTISLAGNR